LTGALQSANCTWLSKLIYVYDYITADVILNHESPTVRVIGQGEAMNMKNMGLKLGGGQAYDSSND
jgi:hypothetical protein